MIELVDDLGRHLRIPGPPRRVVSLVPSDTFSLVRLGAGERLVGRTDYCVEPPELAARVPSVGGTKNPRVEQILDLRPDLVLANQEENTRGDIQRLEKEGVTVLVSFPRRVATGIAHLSRMARALHVERDEAARSLVQAGYAMLKEAEREREMRVKLRVFAPIWMDPLMTIHADTFISDALYLAGAENVFADRRRHYPLAADLGSAAPHSIERVAGRDTRYPRVTLEEVRSRAPDIVLLPDEPHPFTDADIEVFLEARVPASGAITRCPGKDLCWAGAQSIEGLPRLRALVDGQRSRASAGRRPS